MSNIEIQQLMLLDELNRLKQVSVQGNPNQFQDEITHVIDQLEEIKASTPEDRSRHLRLIYLLNIVLCPLPAHIFGAGTDYINLRIRCETLAVAYTPIKNALIHVSKWLSYLAQSYNSRFEISGDIGDLDVSIDYQRQSVFSAPDDPINMAAQLTALGCKFITRFEHLQELNDLEAGTEFLEKAVTLTPTDNCTDLPNRLDTLGNARTIRFERLGRVEDIDSSIALRVQALSIVMEEHPNTPSWLSNLGDSHLHRFESLGEQQDIDRAIDCHTRAISLNTEGEDSPGLPVWLNNLGNACALRFEHFGQKEDITRAIQYQTRAVALSPKTHPNFAMYLMNLGASLFTRFEHFDELVDIEGAIELLTASLLLRPDGHPSTPGTLSNLGNCYSSRFERLGNPDDIDNSIQHLTRAVTLTDNDNPNRSAWLNNLSTSRSHRFRHSGNLEDLEKAIDYRIQALALVPEGHSGMTSVLINLGSSYSTRFERLGHIDDIDKAIEYLTRGISLLNEGHTELSAGLSNLGEAYRMRFKRTNNPGDIRKAMEYHLRVVSITPRGHKYLPLYLNALGNSLSSRYNYSGNVEDINEAITHYGEAVVLTPTSHLLLPTWIENLGSAYAVRFQRHGKLQDLNQAIEHQLHAISLTPPGHARMRNRSMLLGNWYGLRYNHLGRLEDIDKAIELQRQAVLVSPQGDAVTAGWFNNLGISYGTRFTRLKEKKDIDLAIDYQTQAVAMTPEGDTDLPHWLNNLGSSYCCRFLVAGALADLNKAIEHQERAVSILPDYSSHMHGVLSNLSIAYENRFEATKKFEDINKAVDLCSQALAIAPEDHAYRATSLTNLGSSLCRRFKATKQLKDVNDAIDHLVLALSMTSEDDMYAPTRLRELGKAYSHRFNSTADPISLDNALECYRKSAQSCAADPREKFSAACDWIALSSCHATNEHLQACQVAMDLVPEVVWIGSTITQRYDHVLDIGKIASQATAAAIQASKYSLAVEWLEQGRSIIWNQILQLRDPLDELKKVNPLLADQLAQVARELHDAGSMLTDFAESSKDQPSLEHAAQKRRRLAENYANLLTQIRQTPGLENFLRPKRFFELLPAAQNAPVVLINVYLSRCDALVIQPGHSEVMAVSLPDISYHRIIELHDQMERLLVDMDLRARSTYRRPLTPEPEEAPQNQEFESILSIIWRGVTKPVLDSLGYKPTSSVDHIPRITWCATGPLSFLPLHAAGIYGQAGAKVYEYAISSYTPTLSALLPATSQELHAASSILGVGQDDTPGQNPLPQTANELAFVASHAQTPILYSQLQSSDATTVATLNAMEQHDWVHFACHAHQNASEPTESGFFLHDGALSLAMVTQRQFKGKGLAFLSACQTATGDKKLADESVHLASGMLMAGYRSVIATAWSIVDSDAPLVADSVYSRLLKDGRMDHKEAAKALHIAVGHLREHVGEKAFWRWVPYMHIGV